MKLHWLTLFCALAGAPWSMPAAAQDGAPVVAPAASAPTPTATQPGPRPLSPSQKVDNATHDLGPERPLNPQFSIPLSNQSGAAASKTGAVRGGQDPSAAGGIDDAEARCLALTSAQARAACLDQIPREPKTR
jgi:hypothetical protein